MASSTTALVRTPSSSNTFTRATSSSALVPSPSQQLQSRPSPTSTTILPNVTSTPPQSGSRYSTPTAKTPTQQAQQQPSPAASQSTPGRWQHPRMEEIMERTNRTNFDSTNMRTILWNITFLLVSIFVPAAVQPWTPQNLIASLQPWPMYTLLALRLLTLLNIGIAMTPLFRKKDACYDIPLTPAQRQLFGLPPLTRPATPQEKEQWITPPRYSRSASGTPRSSPSSLRAEISGSPAPPPSTTKTGSPFGSGRRHSGSPMTPGYDERRRLSLNRGNSPLSISEFEAAGSVNTPSKVNQRASVGLNSKWLYEKGRASPTGAGGRLSSGGGWGTGSVFS